MKRWSAFLLPAVLLLLVQCKSTSTEPIEPGSTLSDSTAILSGDTVRPLTSLFFWVTETVSQTGKTTEYLVPGVVLQKAPTFTTYTMEYPEYTDTITIAAVPNGIVSQATAHQAYHHFSLVDSLTDSLFIQVTPSGDTNEGEFQGRVQPADSILLMNKRKPCHVLHHSLHYHTRTTDRRSYYNVVSVMQWIDKAHHLLLQEQHYHYREISGKTGITTTRSIQLIQYN